MGTIPLTDIDYYGKTLVRIYARIRFLFPNAKVIFALSTSVKEEWERKSFFRYNIDIEEYNKKRAISRHGVGILPCFLFICARPLFVLQAPL